ncbi:MAG: hypothetical protein AAFQ47_08820 [Pseudomonadota bacterium]
MTAQDDFFESKHLARNIHENFSEVYQRVKAQELPKHRQQDRLSVHHRRMVQCFGDLQSFVGKEAKLAQEIDDILIRFIVIKKTVDHSVPVKPIFQELRKLQSSVERASSRLRDPHRAAIVRDLAEQEHDLPSPSTAAQVWREVSLIEKVEATYRFVEEVRSDLSSLVDFYDYKNGLATAGQPSQYARVFAVHALADLFERESTIGLKAAVHLSSSSMSELDEPGKSRRNFNATKYSGPFLNLMKHFYWIAAPEEISHRHNPGAQRHDEGFEASVRRFAQKRKNDPSLVNLMMGEVTTAHTLEFMKRADAVK